MMEFLSYWHSWSTFYQVSAIIVVGLLLASIVIRVIPMGDTQRFELKQRVRTWWVIFACLLGALALPQWVTFSFFGFVSFLALKEYFSLVPTRRADRRVLLWAYLCIPVQYYFAYTGWYGMFIIFIPVWMSVLLPMRMITIGETQGFLKAIGELQWGLMINVFAISHVAYLMRLNFNVPNAGGPEGMVLYLFLITELNDVFQYISGKLFGRHKIVPKVSPNKTWEGFIGGLVLTSLISLGLGTWLTPAKGIDAVLLGSALAVAGFFGDTTISALKRDLGVKDSGNLLPGHGGILDRIDSLFFTAMVCFHIVHYFYV